MSSSQNATNTQMSSNPQLDYRENLYLDTKTANFAVIIILGIFIVAFCMSTLVALIRRRNYYPITARKPIVLIIWNATSLFEALITTASALMYPTAPPCGQQLVLSWSFLPYVFGSIVRGWILIFHIEIQSHLTEWALRQHRQRVLLSQKNENRISPRHPLCHIPVLDPKIIPGYWCITHRKWMEPIRVAVGACSIALAVFLAIIFFTVINDPDVVRANEERNRLGMDNLPFASTFSRYGFLRGPTCMSRPRCVKCMIYPSLMVPYFVFIIFLVWRVKVNANHMERCTAEENEFATMFDSLQLQFSESDISQRSGTLSSQYAEAKDEADSESLGLSQQVLNQPVKLDELRSVLREFRNGLIIAVVGQCAALLLTAIEPQWATLSGSVIFFGLAYIMCFGAVRQSYEMSRKQMALNGFVSASSVSRNAVAQQPDLSRLSPFNELKNVINDKYAYPVLLKFLQKEYSSENALFYYEAKRFAFFCRVLEREALSCGVAGIASVTSMHPIQPPGMSLSQTDKDIGLIHQFKHESHFGPPNKRQLALPKAPLSNRAINEYVSHARAWGLQIFNDYIEFNSLYQVNISSTIAQKMTLRYKALDAWSPVQDEGVWGQVRPVGLPDACDWTLSTMYRDAEDAVFALIQSDSFTRFVVTKEFAHMVQEQEIRIMKKKQVGHTNNNNVEDYVEESEDKKA
jgi:hypothetical protein